MARKETNFKQTDIGLIPHDWEVVSLGEHSRKIGSGKTPRGGESVYTLSGIPFVRSQNVGYGRMHLKGISYISEALHNEQKSSEIDVNDVLLNITGASIGRCSVADKYVVGGNINQHVCIIRLAPSSFISNYLCNFLLSNNGQEQIQLLQSGGSREGINFGQVGNIKVPLPPLKEQKRIAEVLSHFDEHIDNLVALLEKRKQVKAATMHALLSGTTRLPGFTQPWAETKLGDICEFRTGYTPSKSVRSFWENGTIPWFRMDDIRENGRKLLIAKQYVTEEAVKGGGLFEAGSFILATTATIGEHAWLIADSQANQRFTNLKIRKSLKNTLSAHFFFYYLYIIDEYCKRNTKTGTFAAVDIYDLKAFKVPTPPLKEQEAIADILSNMDRGIEALEEQIEKYRQMKEGAMEELLTGKVRLL